MSSRRHSLSNSAKKIYIDKNSISEAAELRVENLADSVQISPEELEEVIMGPLRFTDDNAERLNMLEGFKEPYLFCSDDLIKMVEVTPSLKTRMEMINMIAPRLVDPSAKVAVFTGMFRFSEEKHSVEEVLKARMNAINALKFTNKTGTNALKGGAGRGGAGRGIKMTPAGRGGGRGVAPAPGRGQSRVTSLPTNLPSSLSASLSPKANTSPKATPKSPLSSRPLPSTPGLVTPQPVRTASGRIRDPSPSAKDTTAEAAAAQMEPAVLPDKRKNPEICPEDGNPSCPSPSSLGETDAETVDTRESGLTSSASATPSATASTSPRPVAATTVPAPIDISAVHAQRPLPPLPYDSPHTDGEGFSPACNTPVETKSVKTAAVAEAERRPSASNTLASALFASVAEDTIQATPSTVTATTSTETASTRSAASATTTESARTTPVPAPAMIEITARAPQRGPPMPSARRPVNGKDGASPVPGASGSQRSPSSLTPSTSSTNLVGMAGNNGGLTAAQIALGATAPSSSGTSSSSAAASSAHPAPAIVVAQPTAQGSYASQCGTYDLAPMVADCKPEVGVHKLLSKFSGSGGTGARPSAGAGTPRTTAASDATPMKTRNINDLTNAFAMKPATSTASSVLRSTHSSISIAEARSQAPAPIVIPGSTVSLAAMRAKFSGGGGGGGAPVVGSGGVPASGSQSAVSSPNRPGLVRAESGSGSATFPATEKKMVRRHSESLGSANSTFAAALAAANASMQAPVAAEVAGAGADLATRCAIALQMTKTEFLALTAEDALFVPEVITDTELPQYSYREVVRRNYHKEYEGLNQSVLELHVCDDDFFAVFLRSKAEYAKLPRWRQVEQKKKALLF